MSRGPKLEQIENHDYSTCRVEVERADGTRSTIGEDFELLPSHEAIAKARGAWQLLRDDPEIAAVHVVNERTGFTKDTISRV